jgi:hypothetical protein
VHNDRFTQQKCWSYTHSKMEDSSLQLHRATLLLSYRKGRSHCPGLKEASGGAARSSHHERSPCTGTDGRDGCLSSTDEGSRKVWAFNLLPGLSSLSLSVQIEFLCLQWHCCKLIMNIISTYSSDPVEDRATVEGDWKDAGPSAHQSCSHFYPPIQA